MLETLHYTIRIGSTPTFLYFDVCMHVCTSHCMTCSKKHERVVIKEKESRGEGRLRSLKIKKMMRLSESG